jgi:hypothetical protein
MKSYNPLDPPDPDAWKALDEQERIDLVLDFHRRARIRVPNAKLHAMIHTIVENQVALGDEIPVMRTLARLISEGLDRHDAVHAVGSVLVGHIGELLGRPDLAAGSGPARSYHAQLEKLTAEGWRRSG